MKSHEVEGMSEEELDARARRAWRLALYAVRRRKRYRRSPERDAAALAKWTRGPAMSGEGRAS